MNLIPEEKLVWSPVVANTRMNRERNASGVNSYEQEFGFRPQDFLQERIQQRGFASWLDLCSGQGKALAQVASLFCTMEIQNKARLIGVDLLANDLNVSQEITCLHYEVLPILEFQTQERFDLITCVHGLHYLGDKLQVISNAISFLMPDGLFIGNLDLNNFAVNGRKGDSVIKREFKKNKIEFDQRTHIVKKNGKAIIKFDLRYLGADDTYGPNYTGQESVTSYYQVPQI
ncbi:class I SAM-dependent methyltransferase [Pseudochryseolinea flava]|uniref:SAM-dependent methyltransferase n=1 Tax=Pseudochryseolinea flava TaxID=2059302 RepID=A0A364XXQ6_9BACT|nr:methyltransferase domain-containing protein [Pseudochryseolinea flava]RAV99190.1 SAM-dependent methyltransferase [Pseudochryseolinea flava]